MEKSPPSRWKTLFSKRAVEDRPEEVEEELDPVLDEKSISDKLLRALDEREKGKSLNQSEEGAEECVTELLGKRNAFVRGFQVDELDDATLEAAREVLRSRFQIEEQAQKIRKAKQFDKTTKASKQPNASASAVRIASSQQSSRNATQKRPNLQKPSDPLAAMQKRQASLKAKREQTRAQERQQKIKADTSANRLKTHQEQRQMTLLTATSSAEEKRIKKKLEQLENENKIGHAMTERLEKLQSERKIKQSVFRHLKLLLYEFQQQEKRASAFSKWKELHKCWAKWSSFALEKREAKQIKTVKEALVLDKRLKQKADDFQKRKMLPRCFYKWRGYVRVRQEQKALEKKAQRRKDQLAKLMERIQQAKSKSLVEVETASSVDHGVDTQIPQAVRKEEELGRTDDKLSDAPVLPEIRAEEVPCTSSPSSTGRSSHKSDSDQPKKQVNPPFDATYVAMQERAAARKLRREELRQRYELAEQKKKEEEEIVRKEIEAKLAEEKERERLMLREKKRQALVREKEKLLRLQQLAAKQKLANDHYHRHLLRHYGIEAMKAYMELIRKRILKARNWYEDGLVEQCWRAWKSHQEQICIERQRIEAKNMLLASLHYEHALQRRAFQLLLRHHKTFLAKYLAVKRQTEWNMKQLGWKEWRKHFQNISLQRRQKELQVANRLDEFLIRRVFSGWYQVCQESKEQKLLELEKAEMWEKVRYWLNE